jgi:transposase
VEGILYRAATGCRWVDLPTVYGSWKTVSRRRAEWRRDGTLALIIAALDSPAPTSAPAVHSE